MTAGSTVDARAARSHERDVPPLPGITLVEGGAEVCVYAGHASAVAVCLFDSGDVDGSSERAVDLTHKAHGWWFGFLPEVGPGQRYGLRVDGPWDPATGQRHNRHKLLLDPYARGIEGAVQWHPAIHGHPVDEHGVGDDSVRCETDSRAYVPRSVMVADDFDWGADTSPRHLLGDSVIYEVHVANFTKLHPDIPEELRGTYAGLAHPAAISHLQELGVTAVELLPIHSFTSEGFLARRGRENHWGYNTLGFFAPHAGYAHASDPQDVLAEFKGMVKLLHAAGIEVILDVVYNHTCEQGQDGATLSWRGLDNRAYYRLDESGRDVDVTGCGNTLDLRHPIAARMVLDSLRYWVNECHIDGFRFDLTVALARGRNDAYDPDHPFLIALRTDPVLSRVKLIAEPWDVGPDGWRTGQFPPPFSEWNDRFRDTTRAFWVSDVGSISAGHHGHGIHELATRFAGSQDLFGRQDRGAVASINFVAAHDGFTTADVSAYDHKHNEANGEDNRDGHDHNRSWNHGVEGPTDRPEILLARRRTMRNLLATTILATGVPMLNGGDEFGRSQHGNNNAYCQNGPISWFDWDLQDWQRDLLATTAFLTGLRRRFGVLRKREFFTGRPAEHDGTIDLTWYAADGTVMGQQWDDPGVRTVQMYLDGRAVGSQSLLLVLHGGIDEREVTLPTPHGARAYEVLWDSTWERPRETHERVEPGPIALGPCSLRVLHSVE